MKKFLFMLCLCLSLALCLPTAALAAEATDAEQMPKTEESLPEADASAPEAPTEENPLLLLYEQLRTHLPEVFSALSLLGACILAFCYKRGLLPILKDGISAIGNTTQEWKNTAESYAKDTKEICENANNSIQFTNSCIEKMQHSIETVEKRLAILDDQKNENEIFKELLRGQVDMLYDIFLSSSLPQFEKDRVGKRVEEMKKALEQKTCKGECHANE